MSGYMENMQKAMDLHRDLEWEYTKSVIAKSLAGDTIRLAPWPDPNDAQITQIKAQAALMQAQVDALSKPQPDIRYPLWVRVVQAVRYVWTR